MTPRAKAALLLLAVTGIVLVHSCGDDSVEPPPNQRPVPEGAIPDQTVAATESVAVDASEYFSDPDGDALSYEAESSGAGVATVSVSGSTVRISGVAKGVAAITVTASDPGGLAAEQSFDVTVVGKPGFLNVVLDFSESDVGALLLRVEGAVIDSVRAGPGLTAYHAAVPGGVRVFLVGAIPESGAILRFWTDDSTNPGTYRAVVEEAAGEGYEQRPVQSAEVTITRAAAAPTLEAVVSLRTSERYLELGFLTQRERSTGDGG